MTRFIVSSNLTTLTKKGEIKIGQFNDLAGKRFGKLTVIKRAENKKNKTRWLCLCDCGRYHITNSYSLIAELCKSCGCLNTANQIKHNKYDLSGEFGIGYTSKGETFKFDLEDYDLIKRFTWYINKEGYVQTNYKADDGKQHKLSFHRLVMNVDKSDMYIDHIYHNKTDNRKNNLRIVNNKQNSLNLSRFHNNTSGKAGVYWHKKHKKWEALIGYNGKIIYLGMFKTKEEAICAREEAEKRYFGEYRYIAS